MDKVQEKVIGSLDLSQSREIRVQAAIRDRGLYVDIRNYFLDVDNLTPDEAQVFAQGEIPNRDKMKPTYKGIQLKDDVFIRLMDEILIPLVGKLKSKKVSKPVVEEKKVVMVTPEEASQDELVTVEG